VGRCYGRDMTPELFWELARQYGIAFAIGAVVIAALISGKLRPKREFDQDEKDKAALIASYERQLTDQRKDLERQLIDMTKDRDYYRESTMELLQRYDREVSTSETAVKTAAIAIRRRA
jgi:hypothetical protein